MAINTQKFLPPSKKSSAIVAKKTMVPSKVLGSNKERQKAPLAIKKLSSEIQSYKEDGVQDDIIEVQVKVISIDKLLKGSVAFDKKQVDDKRKSYEKERAAKKEDTLEKKAKKEEPTGKLPSLPKLGFLDWIKNFITNVVLGYFAVRLLEHLPKLKGVLNFAGAAFDFVIDWGGKILNGLVTFVDWGYKAYDATRGFIKNLFGEGGVKQFDQLSSLLNQFLNLAIIAGMAVAGSGISKGGKGTAAAKPRTGVGGKTRVTTSGGRATGRPDIRNPFRQRPQVTAGAGGNPRFRLPGTAPKVTIGSKGVTKFLGKGLARVPIVGGLIDFALNLALGEKPGRAAAKAIGSTAGAALGTLIPIPVAGTILGGILGDIVGGALYDALMPKSKMAGGGRVSREGETKGGVSRSVKGPFSRKGKKGKGKRKLAPRKPTEVEFSSPGADIGGEEKLFGLFPNPLKMAQQAVDVINPFKTVENTGKNLGKTDYFGPILAITSKITLGQKPSQQDYERVGMGINLLFAEGINKGQIVGGVSAAFAEGGLVDPKTLEAITNGGDITKWVAATFKDSTESNSQRTLREIKENANKKSIDGKKGTRDQSSYSGASDPNLDVGPGGTVTGGNADFWTLVAIARMEDSDPQGSADVAQSIYNRVASGIYGGKTIKELVLREGQYEPTWKYPRRGKSGIPNPEWHAIKDLASASAATGISQADLQKTAAALRNSKYQEEARKFVGGRTDFMGGGNKKGAEDVQRTTNTPNNFFGWFVGPAAKAYGAKNPGPASAPQLGDIVVMGGGAPGQGGMMGGGNFIQGNSGASEGVHFHIGPGSQAKGTILQRQYFGDAQATAKQAISYFLGKGSKVYDGRRGVYYKSGNEVASAQQAHTASGSAGGIDLQVDFEKPVPFPLKTTGMKYRPNGFGVSADIVGSNSFVAHARYDESGKVAPQEGGYKAYEKGGETLDGPHLAMIGEKGKEIVIDNNSTVSDPQVKNMLLAINQASNRKSVIEAIRQYAPYDVNFNDEIVVVDDGIGHSSYGEYYQDQSPSVVVIDSGGYHDPFESLDMIG